MTEKEWLERLLTDVLGCGWRDLDTLLYYYKAATLLDVETYKEELEEKHGLEISNFNDYLFCLLEEITEEVFARAKKMGLDKQFKNWEEIKEKELDGIFVNYLDSRAGERTEAIIYEIMKLYNAEAITEEKINEIIKQEFSKEVKAC